MSFFIQSHCVDFFQRFGSADVAVNATDSFDASAVVVVDVEPGRDRQPPSRDPQADQAASQNLPRGVDVTVVAAAAASRLHDCRRPPAAAPASREARLHPQADDHHLREILQGNNLFKFSQFLN